MVSSFHLPWVPNEINLGRFVVRVSKHGNKSKSPGRKASSWQTCKGLKSRPGRRLAWNALLEARRRANRSIRAQQGYLRIRFGVVS
jgi:hypothetical protein